MTENELLKNKKIKISTYNDSSFYYMEDTDKFPFAYEIASKINGEFRFFEDSERIAKALKYCYVNKMRCRIWYGNRETGESWLDEMDVTGYIGCSDGQIKIPLLVYKSTSYGGTGVLTPSVIRIDCIKTKEKLYEHKNFHVPSLVSAPYVKDGCTHFQVWNGTTGRVYARFETKVQAERYIAFMKGERYSK